MNTNDTLQQLIAERDALTTAIQTQLHARDELTVTINHNKATRDELNEKIDRLQGITPETKPTTATVSSDSPPEQKPSRFRFFKKKTKSDTPSKKGRFHLPTIEPPLTAEERANKRREALERRKQHKTE